MAFPNFARLRAIEELQQNELRTLEPEEVFGDIVNLELGEHGVSVWRADKRHVFARSGIVRGHYIFVQANSLAVAIVDAKQALTAKATMTGERLGYTRVNVVTKIDVGVIFIGDFFDHK